VAELVRRTVRPGLAVVALVSLVGTACLGGSLVASSRGTTRVESVPSGAEVFVMGERLGTTPLEVEDRLIFPVSYPSTKAELYGRVVLQREGCEAVARLVDLRAANEGLVVELVCGKEVSSPESPPEPEAP
jgi:hypothetical protein